MKIYSVGIGPGDKNLLTPAAIKAINESSVIVAYTPYLDYIIDLIADKKIINTGMKKERERAALAFEAASSGDIVSVISSGDSGIYGMAPLLWEMKMELNSDIVLEVIPGISSMFDAAAKLGAPLGHDFCAVSLSDLLTPWKIIEKRIRVAAMADFVTAVYNPVSKGRFWQLMRLKDIFLEHRDPSTPVGIARQTARSGEDIRVVTLGNMQSDMADMFTLLIIGNSQSFACGNNMITPRGYYSTEIISEDSKGRTIMNESFRNILSEIDFTGKSLQHKWVALHCIHTTADFNMNNLLEITSDAVLVLHQLFHSGKPPVVITDVTMVTKGIRKSAADALGMQIKCYLDDPDVTDLAASKNITRTQAGIQLAVEENPHAVFVFGNAPTALMELVSLIRKGKAQPSGVIAAPVGFVNVEESKWQLKYGCPQVPAVIINGRKGGSNVAATIVNAILSWGEAVDMHPGMGL
jgi:precorrin-3B C17-methyltransferase